MTAIISRQCRAARGLLSIFDLGYWDYGLLLAIEQEGGFFLSQVKNGSVLPVAEVLSGLSSRHPGSNLMKIPRLKSTTIPSKSTSQKKLEDGNL
jgi:hypothetical protein